MERRGGQGEQRKAARRGAARRGTARHGKPPLAGTLGAPSDPAPCPRCAAVRRYLHWEQLCAQVSENLLVTAPVVTLLQPPGKGAPDGGEAAMRVLTAGFVEGRVAQAEVRWGVRCWAEGTLGSSQAGRATESSGEAACPLGC